MMQTSLITFQRQIDVCLFIISKLGEKRVYCTIHYAKQLHVNLVHILHNKIFKNWVSETVPQGHTAASVRTRVQLRIQIQVLSYFNPHVLSIAYSAVWFQTDLASYSQAAFNAMTDLSSTVQLNCMQNQDNCFPKFTLLFPWRFPPTALQWNSG